MSHHKKHDEKDKCEAPSCGSCGGSEPRNEDTKPAGAAETPTEAAPGSNLEQQVQQLKNQLLRVSADYQNYQKRTHRQLEQTHQHAQETLIRAMLPVIDNFELTLGKAAQIQDVKTLLDGVRIIYDHMMMAMKGFGLKKIAVRPGEAFDHNVHEAVMHEEGPGMAASSVVRELAGGYTLNDRPLRPAKVSVSKSADESETESEPGQDETTSCDDE
jgi:molecular chaperone GrpE